MTEQEAKTNITCHLSIGVQPYCHPLDGQGIRDGGPWNCLGSVCSAWRWARPNGFEPDGAPREGYCGLAGKP